MTDKITLPMDVSKGIQFDFTVEGITEDDAKFILDMVQRTVNNLRGAVMGGGYVSVAHMEELEKDRLGMDWRDYNWPDDGIDLLDMVDDGISIDDIEDWENIPDDLLDDYDNILYGN